MKNTWYNNKFIKNNWLIISIILFTCFIIIPVMLNAFKINEGFDISNNTYINDASIGTNTIIPNDASIGTNTINPSTNTINPSTNTIIPNDVSNGTNINNPTQIIREALNVFDIDLNSVSEFITQLNGGDRNLPLSQPIQQVNHNLHSVYKINKDLSNNVYRKSDSIKDIYDTSGNNLLNTILSRLSGLSTKIDDMKKKDEEPIENIKCIADFGTKIGDDLCCGQSGVLTDTKYVCPENYSKCNNMKCGSKYGTCVKA